MSNLYEDSFDQQRTANWDRDGDEDVDPENPYITEEYSRLTTTEAGCPEQDIFCSNRAVCAICCQRFPPELMAALLCHDSGDLGDCCLQCAKKHFEKVIQEEDALYFSCPICSAPDRTSEETEPIQDYFNFLSTITVPRLGLSEELLSIFNRKINIWGAEQISRPACIICSLRYPEDDMTVLLCHDSNTAGQCCLPCARQHFEIVIKEKDALYFSCPVCSAPDKCNDEGIQDYFNILSTVTIPNMGLSDDVLNMFHQKMNISWGAEKSTEFIHCPVPHCSTGFMVTGGRLTRCPTCHTSICWKCKKVWDIQHFGISCEQFAERMRADSPNTQERDLIKYIELNGVKCPKCATLFERDGGCDHMTCSKCGHMFCRGCGNVFVKRDQDCSRFEQLHCRSGLHAHHPRNCWFYLRDETISDLQELLQLAAVEFDKENAFDGATEDFEKRYKEYLVNRIREQNVDPVCIAPIDGLKAVLMREAKNVPVQGSLTASDYRLELIRIIELECPLL